MKFIKLTHGYYGYKMLIAVEKIDSLQQKYNNNTGEPLTLVTYGVRGHYVKESLEEVLELIDYAYSESL